MPRIVHLGLGNFHRAHQAWYTAHGTDWTITGVVMRNAALCDQLTGNQNAFALGIWGPEGLRSETLKVYDSVLLAAQAPQDVVERIADPATQVVTLTITEKAYHLYGPDNRLNTQAEEIQADLKSDLPRTALGLLADGLRRRCKTNGMPLTVVSCDNLADNGSTLAAAIRDYLEQKAPDTLSWLSQTVTFPNTMVDRITPRLSVAAEQEIASLAKQPGLSIVGTEDFSEWVIEDTFAGDRPSWDHAGALFVNNVQPFEERKLRLLNAAHSYLAYTGVMAGYRYVHEAIDDPVLRQGVQALWTEARDTISSPALDTVDAYCAALLARFSVPALRHELEQIAMDGSLKLRERLVPIQRARAKSGLTSPAVHVAVRAWIDFVRDRCSRSISITDPNAGVLQDIFMDDDKLLDLIGAPASHS